MFSWTCLSLIQVPLLLNLELQFQIWGFHFFFCSRSLGLQNCHLSKFSGFSPVYDLWAFRSTMLLDIQIWSFMVVRDFLIGSLARLFELSQHSPFRASSLTDNGLSGFFFTDRFWFFCSQIWWFADFRGFTVCRKIRSLYVLQFCLHSLKLWGRLYSSSSHVHQTLNLSLQARIEIHVH